MAAAILTQGKTKIRNLIKAGVTHVGVTDDSTAFGAAQTVLNPAAGSTTNLIKAATKSDVTVTSTDDAFDAAISIDGTTEFTGKTINTIGILDGAAAGNVISRSVRSLGIGVQSGDQYTIAVRVKVEDNS